jgi:hypothetical protein
MDMTLTLSFTGDSPDFALEQPAPASTTLCTADVAECTCPDFCERDHGNE